MTLAEIIAEVNTLRPNQFTAEQLTGWVNEVERRAVEQVINRALGNALEWEPYKYAEADTAELLIPDEHKDVYVTWLFAKMDYINAEIDRYNADATMHGAAWKDYASEYRRTHYPKPFMVPKGVPNPAKRKNLTVSFVPVLPSVGDEDVLYFVMAESGSGVQYDQFMYRSGTWVSVGVTSTDLSGYWNKSELTAINTEDV